VTWADLQYRWAFEWLFWLSIFVALGQVAWWACWHGKRAVRKRRRAKAAVPPGVLPKEPEWVPLTEAARQLYETARTTKGSSYATAADHDASESETLTWFATHIHGRASIYGSFPPSQEVQLVARMDSFSFEVDGGEIVAREKMGVRRWVGLKVKSADLARMRTDLAESGGAG
jgi:hypothetical protein